MQGTQTYPTAAGNWPHWGPIVPFQIVQQWNLMLQIVESLASHGLLASIGRIRQSAQRSQATMVGACKKMSRIAPAFTQQ
jgi:hypothetical protein